MADYEPLRHEELSPAARGFIQPDSPPGARMAAARGLLPLVTTDLASLLYYLIFDEDRRIARTARRSLVNLPPHLLDAIFSAANVNPKLLDFFAKQKLPEERLYERLLFNRVTDDRTVAWMARNLTQPRLLDLIASNQERMIRHPDIIRALATNPNTPASTLATVRQFYSLHTGSDALFREIEAERAPAPPPPAPPAPVEEAPAEAIPEIEEEEEEIWKGVPEEEAPLPGITIDDLAKEEFDTEIRFSHEFLVDAEEELTAEQRRTLAHRIRMMGVVDQMRLGLHGNTEARQILIKSPNKLVQECVLRNPRITIEEVMKVARDKSMREELIRQIASNKEWAKNYQVRLNLAWNPKTPITYALKYLNTFTEKDLATLAKSKAVPGMLAVAARKLLQQKQRMK